MPEEVQVTEKKEGKRLLTLKSEISSRINRSTLKMERVGLSETTLSVYRYKKSQ
jgi:DNA-binding Xre family transcriptional regulator